jgi:hypothetical protein
MSLSADNRRRIVGKYASSAAVDPAVLEQIIDDVVAATEAAPAGKVPSPFAAPWLDSFLAHWALGENVDVTPASASLSEDAVAAVRNLVDVKFRERLAELQRFIRDLQAGEPPDGGPPEPGTPPAGPEAGFVAAFVADEPPDGGPPEPGTPPAGPEAGFVAAFVADEPPDGGPPEPGTPPVGPEAGFLADNPWILYWFISLRAPMLLDVIDAHLTRRLEELSAGTR